MIEEESDRRKRKGAREKAEISAKGRTAGNFFEGSLLRGKGKGWFGLEVRKGSVEGQELFEEAGGY
jgi:hypothetical protein